MEKYMVGSSIIGYNTLELGDKAVSNIADSIVVVIVDDTKVNIPMMYTFIKRAIINRNKVMLVSSEDSTAFRVLSTMMASMGRYDIYKVADKDVITAGYLETIEEREPDYIEVQNYIGGYVAAYSEITEMIMKMQNMIDEADISSLKKFIEENRESLNNAVLAIDEMKKGADLADSNELVNTVEELRSKVKELEESEVDLRAEAEEALKKKDSLEESNRALEAEKKTLMTKIETFDEQLQNGTPVINYYNQVNLAYVQHKIQRVLYFKEISYVEHTMSMIKSMCSLLGNARKMNVKFVIYDSATEIYEPYVNNNIKIISSKNYTVNKPMLIGKNTCLITEPNPAITNDLLTAPNGFDVLIIYDRMHRYENIVVGNNVTRIIVTSSNAEFEAVKGRLEVTLSDMLLVPRESSIHNNASIANKKNIIDIERIPDYNSQTESAKVAKYAKMQSSDGMKTLDKIFKASNIEAMFR